MLPCRQLLQRGNLPFGRCPTMAAHSFEIQKQHGPGQFDFSESIFKGNRFLVSALGAGKRLNK